MDSKEPVLLVVLVETAKLRWYVGCIGMNGEERSLLCSEEGNLSPYLEVEGDEKLSFLRHRFCGVLQRGCDRLWRDKMKPRQFVFVTDGTFIQAPEELTERVAQHMEQWLLNPPVVFYSCAAGFPRLDTNELQPLSGELPADLQPVLAQGLPKLCAAMADPDVWVLTPGKLNA